MAKAEEEKVLRLWQGLGYYSRARNLHLTARYVSENLNGQFPSTYAELIKLKGVGPYTAAAIASICFKEPKPVVDGNVFRFASRYFGIETDITSCRARKEFEEVLEKHIPSDNPGAFNQGLMEFGSTVCSPSPKCDTCIFNMDCFAKQHSVQHRLPVKTKKTKVRERHFNYVVFAFEDELFLNERTRKDVWSGLYDFHLLEGIRDSETVLHEVSSLLPDAVIEVNEISAPHTHLLSHQKIIATFFEVKLEKKDCHTLLQKTPLHKYSIKEVLNLPKPKLIVNYLNQKGIN